jgi:hypothetical protein
MIARKFTLLSALSALLVPLAMAADTAGPTITTIPYYEQTAYVSKYDDGKVIIQLPVGGPKDLMTVTAGTVDYLPRGDNPYPGDEYGDLYAVAKADLAGFKFDVHVKDAGLEFTSHVSVTFVRMRAYGRLTRGRADADADAAVSYRSERGSLRQGQAGAIQCLAVRLVFVALRLSVRRPGGLRRARQQGEPRSHL